MYFDVGGRLSFAPPNIQSNFREAKILSRFARREQAFKIFFHFFSCAFLPDNKKSRAVRVKKILFSPAL